MPSPESGKQWPALSPTKKTPSSAAGAQAVREPVALVADGVGVERGGERDGRRLDVVARLVGADADARLAAGRHAPAVAAADERAVDPDVEGVAVAAGRRGWTSRPAAQRRVGRLVVRVGEHAPPAERVDDERRA